MSKALRLTAVLALAAATLAVPTTASAAGYAVCAVPEIEVECIRHIVNVYEPGAHRGQTISEFVTTR